MNKKPEIAGIIPARYGSTRLQGKPLVDIGGKPMIVRVLDQVRKSKYLSRVIVATDDERIIAAVEQAGGEAVMTPSDLPSGTDRAAYIAREREADIFVNIQGDEPFISPADIDRVAMILVNDSDADMGTLVKRIQLSSELNDTNTVKVITDKNSRALYFSRSPIPFYRDCRDVSKQIKEYKYLKHIGIYSYRREFLIRLSEIGPSSLEMTEKLEQLRVLENGFTIKVAETNNEPLSVDTPEDLSRAREYLDVN
ncbi:3-deoxy-manno-octulosonate cytidylyltransferase [bacterium]|nr:3-deoxy-manno-octulosonate cytidylyltransferase [bacterium]